MLMESSATNSFVSPSSVIICGLTSHDQNKFRMVEMEFDVKQSLGPLLNNCIVKIGDCVTKLKLYRTNLGTYELIKGMEWLECHRTLVDFYKKKVILQKI